MNSNSVNGVITDVLWTCLGTIGMLKLISEHVCLPSCRLVNFWIWGIRVSGIWNDDDIELLVVRACIEGGVKPRKIDFTIYINLLINIKLCQSNIHILG